LTKKYAPYYTDKGALNIVKVDKVGKDGRSPRSRRQSLKEHHRLVAGKDGPVDVSTLHLN